MKNITLKLILLLGILTVMHSCVQDDSSLIDGLPDSIINKDPDGSPPRGVNEDWSDHNEVLTRQALIGSVGIYFDPEVNRESEWSFDFFGNIWPRTLSIYGRYGEPSSLYVVAHGEDKSTYVGNYLEEGSTSRNIIDFPLLHTEFDSQTADLALALMAKIVESAYGNTSGSPAEGVWNNKFTELFIYDSYLSQDMENEAERVKTLFSATSETFPSPDSFWFRDWFLPIYDTYNGASTYNAFFSLIKNKYPVDGIKYIRQMNVGEFVHFFSGAAGTNLQPLFENAFGWNPDWAQELLIAQAQFPEMPYTFSPASQIIDVTSEGNATIVVSKDNDGGPTAGEGSLKLIDNDNNSKFLTGGFPQEFYMQQNFTTAQVANKYTMVSGNDAPTRDFKSWELQGSNDGANFELLHKITDEVFASRNLEKEYNFDNTKAYKSYRIVLLENNGSSLIQLSEWRLKNLQLLNFDPIDVSAGAILTASRDNSGGATANEGSLKLIDGDKSSKFLTGGFTNGISTEPLVITQQLLQPEIVTLYEITSANDASGRDPKKWTIEGSIDGTIWEEIDSRDLTDSFTARGEDYPFRLTNSTPYLYYKWTIIENFGDGAFQAAEWRLFKE
ncbi:discoidin domain-containing protein [Leeuwenhoekiella aequorea]|uniref:F5/8 type C domain-containing protein n=1 Tax=Leeuwenhoekiella aequorea TaxID=283736 RepID=A0A4Q0P3V2_9FLAO|nr:discoidin domain-containing protein [Leeuwenhoekiella aequorea]RXG21234.1 hypothetical protein DSM00_2751 [Leeuwenhoekiella aequorea]